MRDSFRGVLEWSHEGNSLTTSSNDACKFYDATLSQVVGWYNDPNLGGVNKTLDNMLEADPDFVMGKCLKVGLCLSGTGRNLKEDKELREQLAILNRMTEQKRTQLKERELLHVQAVNQWAEGKIAAAADTWEQILLDHPTDMHAIKLSQDAYFYLGYQTQIRDSIARVLPFWQSSSIPLKNYLHGMYAFGLEETHFYDKAQKEAQLALDRNPKDGWATHALGHVHEMLGDVRGGIEMYEKSESDWSTCDMLYCHNYWHYALYFIENGDYERAFHIYQKHIESKTLLEDFVLNYVDASSFLYRLELFQDQRRHSNWASLFDCCQKHFHDHALGFNDAHYMMIALGSNKYEEANEIVRTLDTDSPVHQVTKDLLQGMIAYERGQYGQAVDLLNPTRYRWIQLGGSDAQRDAFHQLLVMAAIKSPNDRHRKLAERLIVERNQFKEVSPLNQLLIESLNKRD